MSFVAFTLLSTCVSQGQLCLISAASTATARQLFGSRVQAPKALAELHFTNWRICPLVGFQWRKWDFIAEQCLWKCLGRKRRFRYTVPSVQTVAGEALRTLQHIRIQGIGTEDSVCVACFWKDALGPATLGRSKWVSRGQRRGRSSVFTVWTLLWL